MKKRKNTVVNIYLVVALILSWLAIGVAEYTQAHRCKAQTIVQPQIVNDPHYRVILKICPMNTKTNRWIGTKEDREEIANILFNEVGKGYEGNSLYVNCNHEFRVYVARIKGNWAMAEMEINCGDPGDAFLHRKKNGRWHLIIYGTAITEDYYDGHFIPDYIRLDDQEIKKYNPD